MKTRNKLILSAAAMLSISAAAMVTGTVAWFTTVRQSILTFDNVTVVTTAGNLIVSYVGDVGDVEEGVGGDFTINKASTSTDLSGDGLTLYKPIWNQEGVSALRMVDETTTGVGKGYFTEFQLKIERDNAELDNGFLVYLGESSELIPASAGTADTAAVNSARLAFLNEEKDERTLTWAPNEVTDESFTYITAEADESAFGVEDYNVVPYAGDSFVVGDIENHDELDGTTGHTGGNSPVIADLTNDGTDPIDEVTITVRVWIEGNDQHAINDAIDGVFSIKLNLYAMVL